jgi:hypothetical protein
MIQNKNILHYNLTSFKQKLDMYFSRQANIISNIPTGENRIATEGNRRIKYNRLTHLNLSRLGEFFVSNKWDTTFLLRNSKQTSMISISDTVAHYS